MCDLYSSIRKNSPITNLIKQWIVEYPHYRLLVAPGQFLLRSRHGTASRLQHTYPVGGDNELVSTLIKVSCGDIESPNVQVSSVNVLLARVVSQVPYTHIFVFADAIMKTITVVRNTFLVWGLLFAKYWNLFVVGRLF